MKMQDIAKLTEIQASLAPEPPRKRRPKTAKRKNSSDDDGELFGTRILETKTQLIPPIDKSKFKYWKPWLIEAKVPAWAEAIQEQQPLHVVLGDLEKTPEQILSEKRVPVITTVEVPNVSAPDFSIGWKVKDLVQRYVDSLAKRLKPNLESIVSLKEETRAKEEEDRHCERLQEIYKKFLRAFEEFKDKNGLAVDVGDLTRPFDPEFVRMKQEAAAEARRQVLIVPVQEEVESSSDEEEEEDTVTEQVPLQSH